MLHTNDAAFMPSFVAPGTAQLVRVVEVDSRVETLEKQAIELLRDLLDQARRDGGVTSENAPVLDYLWDLARQAHRRAKAAKLKIEGNGGIPDIPAELPGLLKHQAD